MKRNHSPVSKEDQEDLDFLEMSAAGRFFWGIMTGLLLGIGLAAAFSCPPQNQYGAAAIALFACPLPVGLLFLIFGKHFAKWFWMILRSLPF
jgi:hypothetical protein